MFSGSQEVFNMLGWREKICTVFNNNNQKVSFTLISLKTHLPSGFNILHRSLDELDY